LEPKEFEPTDLGGALAFIDALPPEARRVYVEVWEDSLWRFVYGDERAYVHRVLGVVVRDRRFRVRGVDLSQIPINPPSYVLREDIFTIDPRGSRGREEPPG
jgi:hypothetical protein